MRTKNILIVILVALTSFAFGQKDTIAKFSELSIDSMGKIMWTITYFGKGPSYSVTVEQYKNNKWIKVGEHSSYRMTIPKSGSSPTRQTPYSQQINKNSYIVKFHKGTNMYRLKMTRPSSAISAEIQLISKVSNDDGSLWIVGNKILLDNIENYEILNQSGDFVFKGEDKTIDISSLPQGSYFFYTKKATRLFNK